MPLENQPEIALAIDWTPEVYTKAVKFVNAYGRSRMKAQGGPKEMHTADFCMGAMAAFMAFGLDFGKVPGAWIFKTMSGESPFGAEESTDEPS
jgi:hypothetical protein